MTFQAALSLILWFSHSVANNVYISALVLANTNWYTAMSYKLLLQTSGILIS